MQNKSRHIQQFYQIPILKNIYLLILLITLFFYLPVFVNPSLVLQRDNDLQQQFWPIFYFIKETFAQYHSLPFWNNLFFSGLPLLPDPQFSLFYPLNWLFLVFSTDFSFIIYFLIHTFIGGVAIYKLAQKYFNFSKTTSLFATTLYLFSPRLAGYLEAGHSGLVASWGLLPWVLLSTLMLTKKPKYVWFIFLSLSLAGIFFTHTITFVLALISSAVLFIVALVFTRPKNWKYNLLFYCLGVVVVFGLTAITLLPQIEWMPHTTRSLLTHAKDVYPKWFSAKEFLGDTFLLSFEGYKKIWTIDTEKWLVLGLVPSILSLVGFWHLKTKIKILLSITALVTALIVLNNASPIYKLLLKLDWYVLMRVSTRIWFVPVFIVIILASFALDKLIKTKKKFIFVFLIFALSAIELLYLSWTKLLTPLPKPQNYVSQEVYQFLKSDDDNFRVFCVDRCFSQQEATKAHLELIEGYNTLQQTNYYKHMWQLAGGYWNYYTLSLPPQGDFKENKLKPDSSSLGAYNTKYLISSYEISDKDFELKKKAGDFFIYQNKLFKSRAYFRGVSNEADKAPIIKFTPNYIRVDTSQYLSSQLVLAEVYNPGWKAYLNGKEQTEVLETPVSLRLVNIKPDTKFVDFRYSPQSFTNGRIITLMTILLLISIPLMHKKFKEKR